MSACIADMVYKSLILSGPRSVPRHLDLDEISQPFSEMIPPVSQAQLMQLTFGQEEQLVPLPSPLLDRLAHPLTIPIHLSHVEVSVPLVQCGEGILGTFASKQRSARSESDGGDGVTVIESDCGRGHRCRMIG